MEVDISSLSAWHSSEQSNLRIGTGKNGRVMIKMSQMEMVIEGMRTGVVFA